MSVAVLELTGQRIDASERPPTGLDLPWHEHDDEKHVAWVEHATDAEYAVAPTG